MATNSNYRIPPSKNLVLGANEPKPIQVNFCKNPQCENFGVPAKEEISRPGPNPDRDMNYKVTNTAKGKVPAIFCKSCKEKIPIKSNVGIAAEFERITTPLLTRTEELCCQNDECQNARLSVAQHPECYQKSGMSSDKQYQLYRCKGCGRRMTASSPTRIHAKNRHFARDIFSRIVNKAPVRGTVRGSGIKSVKAYYSMLDFIERQCNELNGRIDRRMISGEFKLPKKMNVSVDVMEYQLNWANKHDRRNAMFSTLCSVDQNTRYVFGMHANYDKNVDSFRINKAASLNGDILKPEAFREYPQYWLSVDEFMSGRKLGQTLGYDKTQDVLHQISDIYANAQTRDDIENRENQKLNPEYCNPILSEGCQVHIPYTCYAHFMLMQQILTGAGVDNIYYYMDCDSMLRAGFMSAFHEEIANHKAHGFYVRYTKFLTTPKKTKLYEQTKNRLAAFKASLPYHLRKKAPELLMLEHIRGAAHIGKWKDKWVKHPIPSVNQPNKAVCWLTEPNNHEINNDELANIFLETGINAVDNIFQISRRLINAFERPIGTSSSYNRVWHGYAPYKPRMVEKYLSLLRTYQNFIKVGDDKLTPAMRLGLVKQPLTFDDVLWPGKRIPKASRTRRKGAKI